MFTEPKKAVDDFVEWINNSNDIGDKTFYPKLKKLQLLEGQYIMAKSGHIKIDEQKAHLF